MLTGNIFKAMLMFAVPIFFSSIFQHLYNTVDTIIVGHTLGENALAAVGAAAPVYTLLLGFALGIGNGVSIVTARCFGAKNEEKIKTAVAAAIFIGIAVSALVTVISMVSLKPFLKILNTPDEILTDAYRYAAVIMLSTGITLAYNMCSGILRSVGDSVIPLIFLVISSVLNILLDLLLVLVLDMGVIGAAVATVLSQAVSVVLCLIYISKRIRMLVPSKRHFVFDKQLYGEMLSQGLSMALMHCIVEAGSTILQAGINKLDTLVIAGHIAAQKVYILGMLPFSAMISATSTFVGQNYGAKNIARVRTGIKCTYLYNVAATALVTLVFWSFAPQLIRGISGSEEEIIIRNGAKYLMVVAPSYFILGLVNISRNALQAIGSKILPLFSSIIELVMKILFLLFFIPKFQYDAVIYCEPVIWCFMAAELLIALWTNKKIRIPKEATQAENS